MSNAANKDSLIQDLQLTDVEIRRRLRLPASTPIGSSTTWPRGKRPPR